MADENIEGTQGLDDEPPKEFWAKLTSLNSLYPHIHITLDKHTFGRISPNTTCINEKRLSSQHCILEREKVGEAYKYTIFDTSSNGTFVNDVKIGKDNKKEINNGDTLQLLPSKTVAPNEIIAYVFTLNGELPMKRKSSSEQKQDDIKRKKLDDAIGDEMKCCICMEIIYQAVTVMPCLHNFCGGCYSQWMAKKKDCPQCRKQVIEVKKNPTLNNLIDKHIEAHPELKRSTQDTNELSKANKISSDVYKVSEEEKKGKARKKTAHPKSIIVISCL